MPDESKIKHPKKSVLKAISILLWLTGFALTFVINHHSCWRWLPDGLLLIGFWPLLWLSKSDWLWLVFGIINVFIGLALQTASFISDNNFTKTTILLKTHLTQQHSPITWIVTGLISLAIGTVILLWRCCSAIYRKLKKQ